MCSGTRFGIVRLLFLRKASVARKQQSWKPILSNCNILPGDPLSKEY